MPGVTGEGRRGRDTSSWFYHCFTTLIVCERISIATMLHSFPVALELSLAGYLGSGLGGGVGGEPVVHNTLGFLLFRKALFWKKEPRGLKEEGGTFPPKKFLCSFPTMH